MAAATGEEEALPIKKLMRAITLKSWWTAFSTKVKRQNQVDRAAEKPLTSMSEVFMAFVEQQQKEQAKDKRIIVAETPRWKLTKDEQESWGRQIEKLDELAVTEAMKPEGRAKVVLKKKKSSILRAFIQIFDTRDSWAKWRPDWTEMLLFKLTGCAMDTASLENLAFMIDVQEVLREYSLPEPEAKPLSEKDKEDAAKVAKHKSLVAVLKMHEKDRFNKYWRLYKEYINEG
eukprot:121966_1